MGGFQDGWTLTVPVCEAIAKGVIDDRHAQGIGEVCPRLGRLLFECKSWRSPKTLIDEIARVANERAHENEAPTGGVGFIGAVKQFEAAGEKFRKAGAWGATPIPSRKPWYRKLDIEKIAVVIIAIFVAAIAVNHFRLVNARIEAARPCADQRR